MVGPTNLVACPLRCGGTFDRRTCLLQGCRAMVDVGQEVWASVGSLKMGVLGARPWDGKRGWSCRNSPPRAGYRAEFGRSILIYFASVHTHVSYEIEVCGNTTANHLRKLAAVLNNKLLRVLQYTSMQTSNYELYRTFTFFCYMAFKFWLLCIAMFIVVIVERNCLLFLQHRRYKINLFLNFLKTVFDQITLKYAENFANCFVRFKSVANHVHVQWTRILNHPVQHEIKSPSQRPFG